jgi:hypothetical protein
MDYHTFRQQKYGVPICRKGQTKHLMPIYKVPGYSVVSEPLAGTTEWARQAGLTSGGALWNNGTFAFRNIRGSDHGGKRGIISNHARGVAMDLSWRRIEPRRLGVSDGRMKSLTWLNTVLDNWELLGVQCVLDYFPPDYGRGWRVDRVDAMPPKAHNHQAWVKYARPTITGAPGGDWFHIEITLGMANNPDRVKAAFSQVFAKSTTTEQPVATVTPTQKKAGPRRAQPNRKQPTA